MATIQFGYYYSRPVPDNKGKLLQLFEKRVEDGVEKSAFLEIRWEMSHYAARLDEKQEPIWDPEPMTPPYPIRTMRYYLSDAASKYTFERLERLGWNGSFSDAKFEAMDANGMRVLRFFEETNKATNKKGPRLDLPYEERGDRDDDPRKPIAKPATEALFEQRWRQFRKQAPGPGAPTGSGAVVPPTGAVK